MITLDKTLVNSFFNLLKNPITSLVIAILTSCFFYYISLSNKTPAYYISNPELIAQKADDRLKILYDDIELSNVYSTSLILWNDGDKYIDYNDFIKNKAIKLYSIDSIKMLSISVVKVSRKDLKFQTLIQNDTVNITLRNDEALEEGDGVKFLLLFTTNSKNINIPRFHIDSRIKGTKDGFVYKNLANYNKSQNIRSLYFLWGVIFFLISLRIIVLYLYKKPIIFRNIEAIIIFTLIIITTYLTIRHIFYTTNLDWL